MRQCRNEGYLLGHLFLAEVKRIGVGIVAWCLNGKGVRTTGKTEGQCTIIIKRLHHTINHHQSLGRSYIKSEISLAIILLNYGLHRTSSKIHKVRSRPFHLYREIIVYEAAQLLMTDRHALHSRWHIYPHLSHMIVVYLHDAQ